MTPPATEHAPGRLAMIRRRLHQGRSALPGSVAELHGSETAKAVGLAGAMIINNLIALGSTVVFARLLNDYGSLAALISYFLILSVVGQALQVATAREGVLGHLGVGASLAATLRRWTRSLVVVTVGGHRDLDPAPGPDRAGGGGQGRPVGRGDRVAGRLHVARIVDPARCAAGHRRLQGGGDQPDRRAGSPARARCDAGGRRDWA